MTVDMSTIEHLDFEVEEQKAVPCSGMYRKGSSGQFIINRLDCGNEARLTVIRGCCGHAKNLCLDCYNALLNSTGLHNPTMAPGRGHPSSKPVFSHIFPI